MTDLERMLRAFLEETERQVKYCREKIDHLTVAENERIIRIEALRRLLNKECGLMTEEDKKEEDESKGEDAGEEKSEEKPEDKSEEKQEEKPEDKPADASG